MSNRHSRNIDLTVRLTYANTNLLLSTAVGALLFLLVQKSTHTASCVPNISQIKDLGCLCKRAPIRTPTVSLCNLPSCRRISVLFYSNDYYFSHVYSNRNWRADSLRQYLKCVFFFGYTSRLLLYFRLYCSLANHTKLTCQILI